MFSKTESMTWFSGSTSAMNASMPWAAARWCELLEQAGADALALEVVGDGERRLGGVRVAEPDVVADRDDAFFADVAHDADQRAPSRPSRGRRGCARSGRLRGRARGSGGSGCGRRGLRRTRRAPGRRPRPGARRRSVVAVAEDDVDGHVGIVHEIGHVRSLAESDAEPHPGRRRGSRRGKPAAALRRPVGTELHPALHPAEEWFPTGAGH